MQKQKSNILMIMTDQHRADWIGCADKNLVDTPHIDSIAENGVRFTRAVCNSPLCAPSRTSMTAGVYPHRIGCLDNSANLPLDQPTFYQALRRSGYRVGVVGKTDLHKADHFLGENGDLPVMYHFGFTDPFETEGKMNAAMPRNSLESIGNEGFILAGPYQRHLQDRGMLQNFVDDFSYRFQKAPLWYTKESVLFSDDFHDSFIGQKSCEFLEKVSDESPWHLFVSFVGPHDPWDPPFEYLNKYADKQFPDSIQDSLHGKPNFVKTKSSIHSKDMTNDDCNRVKQHYAAAIKLIDDCVGKIVEVLEKRGMLENTVILFCSDHGEMMGDHGLFQKSVMYEGALRIPFIFFDPRADMKGENDALVELVDIYPTILDLAGVDYSSDKLDGKSLVPLLTGKTNEHKKYQISQLYNTHMIFDGRYKLIENHNDLSELYDLEADPHELNSLYTKEPQIVKQLSSKLRELIK